MQIIPFLLLIFSFGFLITLLFNIRVGLAERLSLSYLFGIGVFTFIVFIVDLLFNIDYDINNTFSLLISLCITLFVIKYKDTLDFFKSIKFKNISLSWQSVLFWTFLLLVVTYTLIVNNYWPVSDWDALALYDFRAKVFLVDKNLVNASVTNGYFIGYPLLTSLTHLFIYQIGLQNPKFIYSLFYLSFILIFYFSLKRNVNQKKAMLFTLILSFVPEIFSHSMMAYTNLAYTVYLVTGTLYLYEWTKSKEKSDLLISGLLVSLSTWVRASEPFWIIPLIAVAFISIKNKKIEGLIYYFIMVYVIRLIWKYFSIYIYDGLLHNETGDGLTFIQIINNITLDRVVYTLNYLYRYVFSTWGLLLLIFVVSCLMAMLLKSWSKRVFLIIVSLYLAILSLGMFLFTIIYSGWNDIPDSARRMSIFIIPLMLYCTALCVEFNEIELKKKYIKSSK